MKEIQSVGLIGLGAIGMVAASRFQKVIPEKFRIIADRERQKRYSREGISFNGETYDFTFAGPEDGPMDLILIATKSSGLESALDQIAPYVGENTTILSVLNGITSEEIAGRRFGMEKVLYSLFLGTTSTRIGNEVKMGGTYHFFFGEKTNKTLSDRVQAIKALFEQTGICYQIPEDMISTLWQKYVINIGCNQANVLLRCPYGHLQQNPKARALTRQLMEEAARVAANLNIAEADRMVDRAMGVLDRLLPEDKSSMLQDVEAGRPTEIDLFAGELCRIAERIGYDVPLNRATRDIIEAL